jgi:transcription elongation factor Elf1
MSHTPYQKGLSGVGKKKGNQTMNESKHTPKYAEIDTCPHCGSTNISHAFNDIADDGYRLYYCECENCPESFTQIYDEQFLGCSLDESGAIDIPAKAPDMAAEIKRLKAQITELKSKAIAEDAIAKAEKGEKPE